jgi:meso-butanediol dehydrogenase/(S,S)-butanediol dehydrogenase/diacetyl reductase
MSSSVRGAILVTGAASGIGRAVAEEAAARGHDLVLVDRSVQALDEAVESLSVTVKEISGAKAACVGRVADVTDLDSLVSVVVDTRHLRAPLIGVASCAGIEVGGSVLESSVEDWRRAIDVNLTGSFFTLRATLDELISTGGNAVLISSDGGVAGAQEFTAYCASKHGVIGLMRAAALDYGPRGVRINAVAPAFVETPMADRIFDGDENEREFWKSAVPLGRFAQATEVANAVLHLLGDEASYVNGHVYRIDGGSTAGYYRQP